MSCSARSLSACQVAKASSGRRSSAASRRVVAVAAPINKVAPRAIVSAKPSTSRSSLVSGRKDIAAPLEASVRPVVDAGYGSLDVTIVLGSRSDLPVAEKAVKVLKDFGLSYQLRVASAHRAPVYLEGIITKAEANGCKVFIGMAGVAAALPGVIASMTGKPVIGVPCGGKVPYDSLLSIVQMPPGMPVATVGVDRGDNAAVLAVQILAAFDPVLGAKFADYRTTMTNNVIADDEKTVAEYGSPMTSSSAPAAAPPSGGDSFYSW